MERRQSLIIDPTARFLVCEGSQWGPEEVAVAIDGGDGHDWGWASHVECARCRILIRYGFHPGPYHHGRHYPSSPPMWCATVWSIAALPTWVAVHSLLVSARTIVFSKLYCTGLGTSSYWMAEKCEFGLGAKLRTTSSGWNCNQPGSGLHTY